MMNTLKRQSHTRKKIFVKFCICYNTFFYVCMRVHGHVCACGGQRSVSVAFRHIGQIGWPASPVGTPVSASSAGISGTSHHAQLLKWVLGLELRSSHPNMSMLPTELGSQSPWHRIFSEIYEEPLWFTKGKTLFKNRQHYWSSLTKQDEMAPHLMVSNYV